MGLFDNTHWEIKKALLLERDRALSDVRKFIWGKLSDAAKEKLTSVYNRMLFTALCELTPRGQEPQYFEGDDLLTRWEGDSTGRELLLVRTGGSQRWLGEEEFIASLPLIDAGAAPWIDVPDTPTEAALRAQEIIDKLNNNA